MKNTLKSIFYTLNKFSLPKELNLTIGYIFHTEEVYNDEHFNRLLNFCKEFFSITGKLPVCTVMAGTSPKVEEGLRLFNCSQSELADRYKTLQEFATIGYHGHFYLNPKRFKRFETEIRSNNFIYQPLEEQVNQDLDWFSRNQLNHNGIYAGGWWFMNNFLIELLIKNGFTYDCSFSKHSHFINQYSMKLMNDHSIKTGESFRISLNHLGSIIEIQNLIGAPSSPFTEDFNRHLLNILENNKDVVGFINSHDYDLDSTNTLNLFRHLAKQDQVRFFDGRDMLNDKLEITLKEIVL